MSNAIPESHKDLLEGTVPAVLTTIMPDGQPQSSVVWCSYDGTYVLVNTAAGRQKPRNVERDPRVTLLAVDPQNPFRYLEVRGKVEEIAPDSDYKHIDSLAQLYTGKDSYYGGVQPAEMRGTEERIIFKIQPDRVVAFPPQG